MLQWIAFDADDTLWHNEILYAQAQDKLKDVLSEYIDSETVVDRLYKTEMKNLAHYGYGVKSFALSMIETAVDLTNDRITGSDIRRIMDIAKAMLASEVQLLNHVPDTIKLLSKSYDLMVITKGDLLDQQEKLARSGIREHFKYVEVVSSKTEDTYRAVLDRYGIEPQRFLMIGNSLPSDVLPVIAIGGKAVYIPYHLTWEHETVDNHQLQNNGYFELDHIGQLPNLLKQLTVQE